MAESHNEPQLDSAEPAQTAGTSSESGSDPTTAWTPDAVAAWLADHPDFFVDRPALAAGLQLPFGDETVSLTEFRSRRLVDENERLQRRLGELGAIAGENEQLMRRLHTLTLALAATDDPADLFDELGRRLRDDFRADTVCIKLREAADVAAEGVLVEAWNGDIPEWLAPVFDEHRPECGRLTRQKREWLFGDEADEIGSAALVPIGTVGLLSIGAHADDRFQPGMGTLFLELLGETLARRLAALAADRGRRRRA